MVRLNCSSLAERMLVPAFVYFFQMLYPFARVNDPRSRGRRGRRRHGAGAARGARAHRRHRGDQGRAHRRCRPGEGGEVAPGARFSRPFGAGGFDPPLSAFRRYLADDRAHRVHSAALLRRACSCSRCSRLALVWLVPVGLAAVRVTAGSALAGSGPARSRPPATCRRLRRYRRSSHRGARAAADRALLHGRDGGIGARSLARSGRALEEPLLWGR